jgi:aspartate/methionine/tyrosine aminotransferase
MSERTRFSRDPNRFAQALDRARAREGFLDLSVSNPTVLDLPYAAEAISRALSSPAALVYEPRAFGLESARVRLQAELARDGISQPVERIVLTASTSEAYAFAFKLLCDPGDGILVPRPSYPLLEHLARLENVRLDFYSLAYDGAWHVDFASLERSLTPTTRAIVVVHPNNPTGSYVSREELARLQSFGLPLVSDEVFASFSLIEHQHPRSLLEAKDVLVLALGGLSKLAGLPQMKLGWMLVGGPDAQVTEALARLEIVADAFLSVGAPVQHALATILDHAPRTRDAIRDRTRSNLAALTQELASSSAHVLRVEGGWYAIVRMPATRSDDEWAMALLSDDVAVQPGWLFDFARSADIVVSLLARPEDFREGARRIARIAESG